MGNFRAGKGLNVDRCVPGEGLKMRKHDMAEALRQYDLARITSGQYNLLLRSLGVLHRNGNVNMVNLKHLHKALINIIVPEDAWKGGPETVEPLLKMDTPETRLLGYVDGLWRQYSGEE